jgi:hypothetical protein
MLRMGPMNIPTAMRNRISGHPVFLKKIFPRKPMKSIAAAMEKLLVSQP